MLGGNENPLLHTNPVACCDTAPSGREAWLLQDASLFQLDDLV